MATAKWQHCRQRKQFESGCKHFKETKWIGSLCSFNPQNDGIVNLRENQRARLLRQSYYSLQFFKWRAFFQNVDKNYYCCRILSWSMGDIIHDGIFTSFIWREWNYCALCWYLLAPWETNNSQQSLYEYLDRRKHSMYGRQYFFRYYWTKD